MTTTEASYGLFSSGSKGGSNSTEKIYKAEPVSISFEIIQHSVLHRIAQNRQWKDPSVTWQRASYDYSKTTNCRTKVQFALVLTIVSEAKAGTTLTRHFLIIIVVQFVVWAYTYAARKPGSIVILYLAGKSLESAGPVRLARHQD